MLPKGTIIKTTAWHDNTAANKFNPDPAQWVTFGQRSVDEMAHANEVVVYITEADYERIIAERKRAAPRTRSSNNSSSNPRSSEACGDDIVAAGVLFPASPPTRKANEPAAPRRWRSANTLEIADQPEPEWIPGGSSAVDCFAHRHDRALASTRHSISF